MTKCFILYMSMFALVFGFGTNAFAQSCPSGDEPSLVQTHLVICGFEDHDFPVEGSKRAFSDFAIFALKGDSLGAKMFTGEEGVTYLVEVSSKGLRLQELWEVGDKSLPAIEREITCEAAASGAGGGAGSGNGECKLGAEKCILKAPQNPFPSALVELQSQMKKGKAAAGEAEDLIDNTFAQAVGGDKNAAQFFKGSRPKILTGASAEAWDAAHSRLGKCK